MTSVNFLKPNKDNLNLFLVVGALFFSEALAALPAALSLLSCLPQLDQQAKNYQAVCHLISVPHGLI